MRCPKCNYTQSDKNDLCIDCMHDLRETKTKLGLPIFYPDHKYTELVKIIFKDKLAKAAGSTTVATIKTTSQPTTTASHTPSQNLPTPTLTPESALVPPELQIPTIEPLTGPKLIAVNKLLDDLSTELATHLDESSTIELFDIIGGTQKEKLSVLFDTAEEEILDPQKSIRIKNAFNKREVKIESKELATQLKRVVQVFDNPALLLKNIKAKDLSNRAKPFELQNLAPAKRALAFLFDTALSLCIAFIICIALRVSLDQEFSTRIFSFATSSNDPRYFILGTLCCYPLSLVIYSLFTYATTGTTFGELITSSQPVRKEGSLPEFSELLAKAFSLPTNLLGLGIIFTFTKGFSFSDFISDTFLHQLSKEELAADAASDGRN